MKRILHLVRLLFLTVILAGACSPSPALTPPPEGYAATLAAQTMRAMESGAGATPQAPEAGKPEPQGESPDASGGLAGDATPTLPKAATATPRFPSRTPEPTETFAPTLSLDQMIQTGIPTVLPLLTDVLGGDPLGQLGGGGPGMVEVAPEIGSLAPDFALVDARSGEQVQLSRLEGQPVLVNFWATWCPPCVKELPVIQKSYQAHQAEGLEVLALDVEETRQKAANFADRYGLSFYVLLDSEGAVAGDYRVATLPTSYFIDREGVIRAIAVGEMDRETLEYYLGTILE
jgi:peroxiredoxin